MVRQILCTLLAVCALGLCGGLSIVWAQDATVTARVDRAPVRENESFTYILRAEGRVAGQPDVSAFEGDFNIINRSTNTRIQTINGRTQQISEWTYQLMPTAAGNFLLPAIQVGDLLSNSVNLEVLPAVVTPDAPADIFMEVELDSSSVYVQAQAIYTLRLFIGVGTGRATLTAPVISGGEAIIERLSEDRQYQTPRGERDFIVRERRYAIFPQETGILTIGPSTFEAMVIPNRGFSRVHRLRSDAINLEVKAAVAPPASHPDAVWLPALDLELTERWADQADAFSLGVPRTRVLSIVGHGLQETQLPELVIGRADGIRQYPDQPELTRQITDKGIEATRVERYAVIAQAVGEVSIPAAELPWWNVNEERWQVAEIPARLLPVYPGVLEEPPTVVSPQTLSDAEPAVPVSYWPWLSGGLALGWAATVLAWMRTAKQARRGARATRRTAKRPPSGRRLLKQLRAACAADDAQGAQQYLLEWAQLQFSESPPANLTGLAERVPEQLAMEIALLESHLYGRTHAEWSGTKLRALLKSIDTVSREGKSKTADPLVPLYR